MMYPSSRSRRNPPHHSAVKKTCCGFTVVTALLLLACIIITVSLGAYSYSFSSLQSSQAVHEDPIERVAVVNTAISLVVDHEHEVVKPHRPVTSIATKNQPPKNQLPKTKSVPASQSPPPLPPPPPLTQEYNEPAILNKISDLKLEVRKLRSSKKVLMPVDPGAVALTTALQDATRCYLMHNYPEYHLPLNLAIELQFPSHMLSADEWLNASTGGNGIITLYVELAPYLLLPHAVFTIIQIAQTFKSGYFHRNAGHVLQSQIAANYTGGVVFMEYSHLFPHEKYTLGFAGRGGGDAFYISTVNNTVGHGPGTDRGGKDPESDTDFGIVIPGYNGEAIVKSMTKQTGSMSKNGFIEGKKNFINILSLRLLNSKDLLAEIGMPGKIKKSKYSVRQQYLRQQQEDFVKVAMENDYCHSFL